MSRENEMHNASEIITASEINKYMYCPYSWYYERRYGRRHIRKLYLKRLDEFNLTDEVEANFLKGQNFHNKDFGKGLRLVKISVAIVIAFAAVVLLYYLGSSR